MKTNNCKTCHRPFPENAPTGPCPACLFDLAIQPDTRNWREELHEAFPEFNSIELIGQGGMARVFKVHNRSLKRDEALKVIRHADVDADFIARFEREAQSLSKLGHDHAIVAIYATGRRAGFSFIQMEYMPGGDLHAALEDCLVTPLAALRLVPALCTALQHVHDLRTVHRDIKPSNILLNAARTKAKLGDFGIAKVANPDAPALTANSHNLGTKGYTAPEIVDNPASANGQSDIFALGQVIRRILTAAELQSIPVPNGLSAVADKATARDPRQRFQSARALAEEYSKWLNGGPLMSRKPVRILLAACVTGVLFYAGHHWGTGGTSDAQITTLGFQDANYIVPIANFHELNPPEIREARAPQISGSPEQQSHKNALIRGRTRSFEGILEGDKGEFISAFGKSFIENREAGASEASGRIVAAANRIRGSRRIDATQLKSDTEFKALIRKEIEQLLNSKGLRAELEKWAEGVETNTRTRMIRYFQLVIAEDLGRAFDENLRGIVIKAVREIPVEKLIADAGSISKMEALILGAMPESALSETTRKAVREAAAQLTKSVAYSVAEVHGAGKLSPILAQGAGSIVGSMVERGLEALNEELTAKPDPNDVKNAIIKGLTEWNDANLKRPMESAVSDFNRAIIRFMEDEARVQGEVAP
jgi:serine/threonine protein kinase